MKPSQTLASYLTQYVEHVMPRGQFRQVAPRGGGPRMVVAWAMRALCPGLSFPAIANRMGYSDHTSALHAHSRIEEARQTLPEFLKATDELLRDARAVQSSTIDAINNATQPRPTAEELQSIMTDVRRAANRLEKELDRLNAYMEAAK